MNMNNQPPTHSLKMSGSGVIGYTRISSQSQSNNTSLSHQEQKIEEYCKLNDLELTKVYSEIDSGGKEDRVVLGIITELIKSNSISTLICLKMDRLGRNMLGSLTFIQLCKEHGVRVVSIMDNIDTADGGKTDLITNILLSIATEERRQIGIRTERGRLMRWEQNKVPYGKLPIGYKRDKKGEVIVDEKNRPIIEYIFKKWNLLSSMNHLTNNKRMRRLLKLLKKKNYLFFDKNFENYDIKYILSNPFYSAQMRWRGKIKNTDYEPIVSKRLFNKVQVSI